MTFLSFYDIINYRKKNKGEVKLKKYISLGVIGVVAIIIISFIGSIFSFRSQAIDLEERINAQYVSNQSNYDNIWKSFKEITQVTTLQAEQYKDVYMGLITARYEDTNLLFKMIQEDNPNMDSKIYTKLTEEISSGRKTFDNSQKQLTDIIREYNSYIRKHFISNMIFNFREVDAKEFIITSDKTNNAFETGKDDIIELK